MGYIGEHVTLDDPAYIHESAWLYGKVYVGPGASIWPNVVTRAETFEIRIGARTNIQDFVMIHVGIASPTLIGEDCSITHHATCLLYTSPSPRDATLSRMPSSA